MIRDDLDDCVDFSVGDHVRSRVTGDPGVIVSIQTATGFVEVNFAAGRSIVSCDDLEPVELDPTAQLIRGIVGHFDPYALRLQARFLKHAYRFDPVSGLSNARIEPALHQVYIAHRVTQKLQPRMILADEVGLGKTIEAGLIIKELRARGLLDRVLVVCPASLQLQWQQELRSKFNEEFEIFNSAALRFLSTGGQNPWLARDNVICSLQFAASPKQAEKIVEADWDLIVFDEAHRVRRSRQSAKKVNVTQAYRLADELKELSNGLLLLTATPMQLHPFELYSLIELVEPGLYSDFATYEASGDRLPQLNDLMKALRGWEAITEQERTLAFRQHAGILQELKVSEPSELDDPGVCASIMNSLADQHPLAQVLVRNRKAELGGFMPREATRFLVDLTPTEAELYADVTDYLRRGYNRARAEKQRALGFVMVTYQKMLTSSSFAIRQSLRRRITRLQQELKSTHESSKRLSAAAIEVLGEAEELSLSLDQAEAFALQAAGLEAEIGELELLVERLGKARDSKTSELLVALDVIFERHVDEKVIVFTQFIETQEFLARTLEVNGYAVATFNGRMSLDEKELAVHRFRDPDGAQILISTEAGGEGRNFQFAHILVNYDLPWNPMKVEQRIGRLDRIGQKRTVFIYNLACRGTVEERVLDVLDTRIGLFEESVGSLDPILGEVEHDIEDIVMSHADRFQELIEKFEVSLDAQVRRARAKEHALADFAMDRASLRRDIANDLLGRSPLARAADLERFLTQAVKYYGGSLTEHHENGSVISLSPRLATRLRTREAVHRGVFDAALALELEDLDFFAFGHDLVDGLVEMPITVEPAMTGTRRLAGISGGTQIEVFYEIRVGGLRPRGAILHHLIGADMRVKSQQMTSIPTSGESAQADPPDWTSAAIEESRATFTRELAHVRDEARAENDAIKDEEIARAKRIYEYRRVRFDRMIEDQRRIIADIAASDSPSRRKILPAREGQLAKLAERRDRLGFEFEQQIDEIKAREASVEAEIVAAGLVVP